MDGRTDRGMGGRREEGRYKQMGGRMDDRRLSQAVILVSGSESRHNTQPTLPLDAAAPHSRLTSVAPDHPRPLRSHCPVE
eukprot:scaffold118340_cov29-Prasinocladus_malaysianus.AAC.1